MFAFSTLVVVTLSYLLLLFAIAYAAERQWLPTRWIRHPISYALSLGVYATAWSYYGSVGFAQQHGLLFLAISIGPALAFLLTPLIHRPLLRLVQDYQLVSLADLFAFRYGSQTAGLIVTLLMVIGLLPYTALQWLAITTTLRMLSDNAVSHEIGLLLCLGVTLFAIVFGARHPAAQPKHEGLVAVIAFESLIKLLAILTIGSFAVWGVFAGPHPLYQWLTDHPDHLASLYPPLYEGPLLALITLSFSAVLLLPRQFHISFVENLDPCALPRARWLFPLFLLLFNLAILPILWAALALGVTTPADYHVLAITLRSGFILPLIAFIGGLAAASAMVIVTAVSLAQMLSHHLILPISYPDPAVDLYRWLLWGRWLLITILMMAGYGFAVVLDGRLPLVELGLISFAAVSQLVPGLIGVLWWPRATCNGFISGLLVGIACWHLMLFMPLLYRAGLTYNAFNLLDWIALPPSQHWNAVTFGSLLLNGGMFMVISLLTRPNAYEQRAIAHCFGEQVSFASAAIPSPLQMRDQLAVLIGQDVAHREIARALQELQLTTEERHPLQLQRLRERLEINLSGLLGPMLARMIVESGLPNRAQTRRLIADQMRFIDDRLEHSQHHLQGLVRELDAHRRYHRQILHDLPLAACSLSADGEILVWNQAMARLADIPATQAIGLPIEELPAPWATLLADFRTHGQPHAYRLQVFLNNQSRWFNLHSSTIAPDHGGSSHALELAGGQVILIEDLTELHTLEAEVLHSERLATMGRLAAGIAHEIGNPITAIACIAQNLRDETDRAVIQAGIADMVEQTQRIATILKSLRTFSHRGGNPISSVNIRECIQAAQHVVHLSHDEKRCFYHLEVNPEWVVAGDYQKLLQVFVNLLSNACDASRSGDVIEITGTIQGAWLVVYVRDHGEGIPEAVQSRVFEPFFTTKAPGQGTGLGLPLVAKILRDHGGWAELSSRVGVGTQVTVYLPYQVHADPVAVVR